MDGWMDGRRGPRARAPAPPRGVADRSVLACLWELAFWLLWFGLVRSGLVLFLLELVLVFGVVVVVVLCQVNNTQPASSSSSPLQNLFLSPGFFSFLGGF